MFSKFPSTSGSIGFQPCFTLVSSKFSQTHVTLLQTYLETSNLCDSFLTQNTSLLLIVHTPQTISLYYHLSALKSWKISHEMNFSGLFYSKLSILLLSISVGNLKVSSPSRSRPWILYLQGNVHMLPFKTDPFHFQHNFLVSYGAHLLARKQWLSSQKGNSHGRTFLLWKAPRAPLQVETIPKLCGYDIIMICQVDQHLNISHYIYKWFFSSSSFLGQKFSQC